MVRERVRQRTAYNWLQNWLIKKCNTWKKCINFLNNAGLRDSTTPSPLQFTTVLNDFSINHFWSTSAVPYEGDSRPQYKGGQQ